VIPPDRPVVGILFRIASAGCFVATGVCVKLASAVPVGETVFFRSLSAFALVLLMMLWRRTLLAALRTKAPWAHLGRGLIGALGVYCLFGAYAHLPITEVTTMRTMLYVVPFLIIALGALAFGEMVGRGLWAAAVLGFVGVLVVAWPNLALLTSHPPGGSEAVGMAYVLGAIISSVAASFAVRRMLTTEASSTIALYFSLVGALAALATLPFGWTVPDWTELGLLAGAGISGAMGQLFLAESYRNARMSIVAPFEYSSLLFAMLAGIVLFSEWPASTTILGGLIVVCSGIIVIFQQRRVACEAAESAEDLP
jgi:drug/metabolite transporter (DMT)-like permease